MIFPLMKDWRRQNLKENLRFILFLYAWLICVRKLTMFQTVKTIGFCNTGIFWMSWPWKISKHVKNIWFETMLKIGLWAFRNVKNVGGTWTISYQNLAKPLNHPEWNRPFWPKSTRVIWPMTYDTSGCRGTDQKHMMLIKWKQKKGLSGWNIDLVHSLPPCQWGPWSPLLIGSWCLDEWLTHCCSEKHSAQHITLGLVQHHHIRFNIWLPSGKHTKNYGKSPCLMGKSTINDHFQ